MDKPEMDDDTIKRMQKFFPEHAAAWKKLKDGKISFAKYTSASTAKDIISKKELWLRSAAVMNDYSEIDYGLNLIRKALEKGNKVGDEFRKALSSVYETSLDDLLKYIDSVDKKLKNETYITCLSYHEENEKKNGRLSMWRAYGDTALILSSQPMKADSSKLGVFSTPVTYQSQNKFETRLEKLSEAVRENKDDLTQMGCRAFYEGIVYFFFLTAIASKHPGFAEEKEWRVYYRPGDYPTNPSTVLKKKIKVIDGIAQVVWVLPLEHNPDNGLHDADVPNLIEQVIIGPTRHPEISRRAFVTLLEDADVSNAEEKVICSEIPVRL
jgi:Protein of unknown function (DUF2971)